MTRKMKEFIKNYRIEIDNYIKSICANCGRLNNDDREDWILNDEGLYRWARSEGVKV